MRMQASAGFVSASALGMACGPALACLFQRDFKLYNLTFNSSTLPGWFMALAWLLYLIWLRISFQEPVIKVNEIQVAQEVGQYSTRFAKAVCLFQIYFHSNFLRGIYVVIYSFSSYHITLK